MRRKVIVSAMAVAVTALVGALVVTHRFPFEPASARTPAVPTAPVVAGSVISHDVPIYLQGVGTVIAYNTVIVRSQIQGQITKINFTEGQSVHTGDLLAVIDPRPIRRSSTRRPPTAAAMRPSSPTRKPISNAIQPWGIKGGRLRSWSRPRPRKSRNCRLRSKPTRR